MIWHEHWSKCIKTRQRIKSMSKTSKCLETLLKQSYINIKNDFKYDYKSFSPSWISEPPPVSMIAIVQYKEAERAIYKQSTM